MYNERLTIGRGPDIIDNGTAQVLQFICSANQLKSFLGVIGEAFG